MNTPRRISEPPGALDAAPPHLGGLFGRLLSPLFKRVTLDADASERLRRVHAAGPVVHVLRSRRVLDPVFILSVLDRLGLPKPRWMHDHYASQVNPGVDEMLEAIHRGEPVLLFLRRPRTLIQPGRSYSEQHVEALLTLQQSLDRPIHVVPEALIWPRKAAGIRRTIVDVIFGDRESPGRIREMIGFLLHRTTARFHVGAPIDVRAFLEREAGRSLKTTARKIRWAVLNHLSREDAIRAGPIHTSAERTRHRVLKDPAVTAFIRAKAQDGADGPALVSKAEAIVLRLAADIRYGWMRVLDATLDRIWRDIYDGIVVDTEGLKRVWSAARRGSIVLVPSHKSHIDYLVLSQVFLKDGMMPPHIAAGDNLNIPIIGTIFRRSGAFFIRRSIKGDKLYALLLSTYVKWLLKEGHAVEFFIEGGRSRTGKQLAPKMGLLSMCTDPVLDGALADVSFVPVSISYEQIIEGRAYTRELGGARKKKEDLAALVSARRVLRSRYGRVYVDFDEPISLRAFAASRGHEIGDEADQDRRRSLVTQLSHRIGYGIDRVTRITPTSIAALILLSTSRRGMAESELHRRAERMISLLTEVGARTSSALQEGLREVSLREALGRLAGQGLVKMTPSPDGETIYQLDDGGRMALDYYKNNCLHFIVAHTIVAFSVLRHASADGPAGHEEVRASARSLSRLLKLEFAFRGGGFDANFERARVQLQERRIITETDDGWRLTHQGRDAAVELSGLLAVFLESYRLVAQCLEPLESTPQPRQALLEEILGQGKKHLLEGRLRRAEAISQITLKNALAFFRGIGVITGSEAGLVPGDGWHQREEIEEELRAFLTVLP